MSNKTATIGPPGRVAPHIKRAPPLQTDRATFTNYPVCGSPTELLIVLGIVVAILVINAASRARAHQASLHRRGSTERRPMEEDDDGIRVRFLPDDETKDDR